MAFFRVRDPERSKRQLMNYNAGDIIIKNGSKLTVWLSQRLIMEVTGISDAHMRKNRATYKNSVQKCYHHHNILPDSGKSWRWGKMDAGFYYDISRLPNRAPQNYRELFGDAEQLVKNYEEFLNNEQSSDFENQFKRHLNRVYRSYLEFYTEANDVQRTALAKACAVLDFIMDHKDDYPGTKNKIYKDLEPILRKWDLQYIPHHHLRLKEKVDEVFATDNISIVDVIKLPRSGNANAAVHDDPEVLSWAYQLRQMPQNYSNEHIIRKITEQCEIVGKRVPSRRWFGKTIFELPSTKFLTSKRFGSSRKSNIYKSYIPYANALFAGDCWEIDATRVNIISHENRVEKIDEKTGKKKTVKEEKFLMVVAVRDVHSGDVLGYSFSHAENHLVYMDALKMAVQNTGYLPYEIVTDRFPGHNTPQITDLIERMNNLGTHVQFVSDPNAKAKIERYFGTLQSVFMMDSDLYYGEGIMSRRLSAFRSPEYIKKIKADSKKAGFDMYKAVEESTFILEAYRETNYSKYSRKNAKIHKSPKQLHNESEKPHVYDVTEANISMLFGSKTKTKIQNNGQFSIEIIGAKLDYFISPAYYDIIKNYHGKSVVLSYDIEDLSVVFLWEKHGHLLKSLCEAEYFEKPQKYGPNKAIQQVGVANARKKAIEELKENELQEIIGEENLLLGKYGKKDQLNTADDFYTHVETPIKKVSGSDIHPDDFENGYLNNSRSDY